MRDAHDPVVLLRIRVLWPVPLSQVRAMSYGPPTMMERAHEIAQIAESKGWSVPTSFDEVDAVARKLCLIHSEVSEALEALRHDDLENFGEELADVVIRVLHLAHGLGIDLDHEVRTKVTKNRDREYQHGGKRI